MLGGNLVRLIESRADELTEGLVKKLRNSERTTEFRKISNDELARGAREIYTNLDDWLLTKTESDIEYRYTHLGARRASQGVPMSQFIWAVQLSKEHLFAFLQREALSEGALQLYGELEVMQMLAHFFDHAVYYAVVGYEHAGMRKAA